MISRKTFFKKYNITNAKFTKSGFTWEELTKIHDKYSDEIKKYEPTAKVLTDQLREVKQVHSTRYRIKNPEHLIEKIIRKKADNQTLDIDINNYDKIITDIIGIRALHLFKENWIDIHSFIKTCNLLEEPIAYIREGDALDFIKSFEDQGCETKNHPFGYRSVHYLVQSQVMKDIFISEIQVRTIFEEGWSEIDHQIRYPYDTNNPLLKNYMGIFNRLAGSSDEMGSFIKFLKYVLDSSDKTEKKYEELVEKQSQTLQEAIDQLEIANEVKQDLQEKINSLEQQKMQQGIGSLGSLFAPANLTGIRPTSLLSSFATDQRGLSALGDQKELSETIIEEDEE